MIWIDTSETTIQFEKKYPTHIKTNINTRTVLTLFDRNQPFLNYFYLSKRKSCEQHQFYLKKKK